MNDFYYYRPGRKPLEKREEIVAEKALELSNLVGTALVFSQFLSDRPFVSIAFLLGGVWLIAGYLIIWYYLARRQ